ncbi:MAG TPA: right-handed parallel beta-helix repeat-containing protein [Acidimicrobiales bacterium]|nr:right-handed parallel beta-helix repeat-containing protein [Acidimicrobiales bacterium]
MPRTPGEPRHMQRPGPPRRRGRALVVAAAVVALAALGGGLAVARGDDGADRPTAAPEPGKSGGAGSQRVPAVGRTFPNPATTGTPDGWEPVTVHQGDLEVTEAGAVVQDVEVTGSVAVKAPDVTIRRVRVHGRIWNQWYPPREGSALTQFPMTIEDSVIGGTDAVATDITQHGTVGPGSYTLRGSELYGSDGFRVSRPEAPAPGGGDGVLIEGNYFHANDVGGNCDYHLDGVQGYAGGADVVVRGNTIDVNRPECATGAIFFADGSQAATVEGNLLLAPNYPLRVQDDAEPDVGPWTIVGNALAYAGDLGAKNDGTDCGAPSMTWSGNHRVTVDDDYTLVTVDDEIPCDEA